MNIDDLLHNLHEGRQLSVEEQLHAIEREITMRRLASGERTVLLFEQIRELHEQILSLQPENPFAADTQRLIREPLQRERRMLERDLRDEIKERWRDMQELKREQRTLLREQLEHVQRYERHAGQYE